MSYRQCNFLHTKIGRLKTNGENAIAQMKKNQRTRDLNKKKRAKKKQNNKANTGNIYTCKQVKESNKQSKKIWCKTATMKNRAA